MLTSKQIKRLFYVHRELGLVMFLLLSAAMELLASLFVDHPWQYLAYGAAALLALIAAVLVRNVIRFERQYPTNPNN
jgi:membrane protein YdbS with pleckstrin-like domain